MSGADLALTPANAGEAGVTIAASIIIPCFSEDRWAILAETIRHAVDQKFQDFELVLAVDHNSRLAARLRVAYPAVQVVENGFDRGVSGNRNSGALAARGQVLAFLDDDCFAAPDWLALLCQHLDRAEVIGVGGRIVAHWPRRRPSWFPDEFDWVIGASYRGLPDTCETVRNVWSGNMAVKRDRFTAVGGFQVGFGKLGAVNKPEDTDLCIRLGARFPEQVWLYEPAAVVEHQIPAGKVTPGFFLRRCWNEGVGKAALRSLVGSEATTAERNYARRTLPRGVARGIADSVSGRDRRGVLQSVAICVGLLVTAAGMANGVYRERGTRRSA
jgi:glycosyltransferase involved in cell wall biosynthesis